jgi:hypothetical protein
LFRARATPLALVGATAVAAAAVALPVAAHDPPRGEPPPPAAHAVPPPGEPPPPAAHAVPPRDLPEPAAAPDETRTPPKGTAAEDELPLTDAQRQAALAHLRAVAACARSQGADVPDPVADADGVHLSWLGPERPQWEAALGRCDALSGPAGGPPA